ncbi:MAG TPA: DNA recombination protein RmuC [Candidatus Caccopulliclostridium gallistercoris]|uniref:DNA recombination protein RmuC n=1 Tax=Candidatus Caccopulliclostridium gallistercoris TaxID=2840719 RepID=A0A9D1SZ92_9FIRM|nr:DNA recombination protein RmuC [Candidatus Caccopulliclostridium gallistercoris]
MALEIICISLIVIILILNIFLIIKNKKTNDNSDLIKNINLNFEKQNEIYKQINEMLLSAIKNYNETVLTGISQNLQLQKQELIVVQNRLESILKSNEDRLARATQILDSGLTKLQTDNEKKLEQMRQTVDEKLNVSLEKRLAESFNIINNRLQSVYEGLGEMKQLATGVGDLKKVLTNVKTRGVWGEVSLANLLEQMLSPDQFSSNVAIKDNQERVDFAIALPGKDDKTILLPVDAKFPIEDYQRLVEASETGNVQQTEAAKKGLEKRVKEEAKKISEKYILLPKTTDFAVMYLALEGLYAEVLRMPGLAEELQREYKVVICGPTTLSALLNSLQLGFKTLSIEKRSSEIWQLLGVFKQEFGKFVDLLAKTQKKLAEASNTIESATKKSRTIERKLKNVTGIEEESDILLESGEDEINDDGE